VFGSWTTYYLRQSGRSVALLDAYGPANSRASSGDESRVLRMGYGADEIYTRWTWRARQLWLDLFEAAGQPDLFQPTGVLQTPLPSDARAATTRQTLEKCGVRFETLKHADLEARFPQFHFETERIGILELDAGALMARRAVRAVVNEAVRNGVDYFRELAGVPEDGQLKTRSGEVLRAGLFVFACGPWLPKIFPDILQGRIRPTRQEVFYFGVPAGDRRFSPQEMPVWLDFSSDLGAYSLPDFDGRGLKLAFDRHGPDFDPDTGDRLVSGLQEMRSFLSERFPALANAPLSESRVCQYENTSTGDFLIDRHPERTDVWLVGGGSGHGFKHGPALGEYVAKVIDGAVPAEPRFSLETKTRQANRAVY
jgi:sarcosine oxidase